MATKKKTSATTAEPDATILPDPLPDETTLRITSPADGTEVPTVHDVLGDGAAPLADVELWSGDRDPETGNPNATVKANADGAFGFTGDTPAKTGELTWMVRSGDVTSDPVSITVVEPSDGPDPVEYPPPLTDLGEEIAPKEPYPTGGENA